MRRLRRIWLFWGIEDIRFAMKTERSQLQDWPSATIEEVTEKVAMGPFGSSIKVDTFVPDGIPVITGRNLHGVRVDDGPGFNFITEEHACRLANANVGRGDIVLTHRGTIGQVAYIPNDSRFERYVVSQSQFYIRCDEKQVLPEFLASYLQSPVGQHLLLANTSQVGVPSIAQPVTYLRTLPVPLPSLPEQRRIAHILGTLDDKIELNRRMNETLEEMAQAIFKDWFVDFGPVRAKMEGREAYLPEDVWRLFPDRLAQSELGEVPEGWGVKALSQVIELLSGGTPKTSEPDYWDGEIPWYTAKDAPNLSDVFVVRTERTITQQGVDNSATKILPAGTTVITARGTVGRLACLGIPMAMNQTCYGIRGLDDYEDHFTYWLIRMAVYELMNRTHGTIFDTITRQTFDYVQIAAPSGELALAFENSVAHLMGRIIQNLQENHHLATSRDALLPGLVSGEVRVIESTLMKAGPQQ